ncbi:hypothetical protein PMZ80_010596 [Knufia obscura]|uniref:Uncharacterized protein n=1 Tax=Knufia obscura TaxID=1635080 RepID=A0ABR0R921_9EURO|nr:hypothetical protein PMZ80_010596 [Knufia obscura]
MAPRLATLSTDVPNAAIRVVRPRDVGSQTTFHLLPPDTHTRFFNSDTFEQQFTQRLPDEVTIIDPLGRSAMFTTGPSRYDDDFHVRGQIEEGILTLSTAAERTAKVFSRLTGAPKRAEVEVGMHFRRDGYVVFRALGDWKWLLKGQEMDEVAVRVTTFTAAHALSKQGDPGGSLGARIDQELAASLPPSYNASYERAGLPEPDAKGSGSRRI